MARDYPLERYRNFGIMAHIDAGKTTTSERILLFNTGRSHKIGEVHDGAATMDWMEQEQERASRSLRPPPRPSGSGRKTRAPRAPRTPRYGSTSSTPPDTWTSPSRVERSLAVLDGAVAVLDANAGVEPQTETAWRQADRYKVPRMVFVNKMDKIGADFFNCVKMIKDRNRRDPPCPDQLPDRGRGLARGIVDLVTMEEWVWKGEDLGASWARSADPRQPQGAGRGMAPVKLDRERGRDG